MDKRQWAQFFTETGRLTGYYASEPERTEAGKIAPGWVYMGDLLDPLPDESEDDTDKAEDGLGIKRFMFVSLKTLERLRRIILEDDDDDLDP